MIEFSLLFVSIILFFLIAPLGILTRIILIFVKDSREQFTKITDYPFAIAHTIDILGNIVCADLFNIIMLKHDRVIYRFGMRGETISSAFGKNVEYNWKFKQKSFLKNSVLIRYKHSENLTKIGNGLYNLLDFIDPNHCIKSIQSI